MRDGNNEDVISFDCVKHGVRKDPRSTEAHILFKNTPTVRCSKDLRDGGPDFPGEALAKSASATFVKLNSLLEFQKRLGMELMPHFANRRSMRR